MENNKECKLQDNKYKRIKTNTEVLREDDLKERKKDL